MASAADAVATETGVFDPEEAAVAVIAATIDELRERRAARRREERRAGGVSPWVLAGRVAATRNLPR